MCAIFGIIGRYDAKRGAEAVNLMQHRGPDRSSFIEENNLFLGHNRLSIVDRSCDFHQPMHHEGVYALFNGEIYNYKALKEELGDYAFESLGDSEVVLAAYLRWGEAFIHRLEGMFAIAIIHEERVLLYRDRMGKKPLYYYHDNEHFIFASELKALVHYKQKVSVAPLAVESYLFLQTSIAPQTPYKEIVSLEAGQSICFEKGVINSTLYDEILPCLQSSHTKEEALETLDLFLNESIRKRIESEVPLGFLLSGGVDSSLIAALAQQQSSYPIETFSLGYEEFERYDERHYAKEVAAHIGSTHREIIFGYEDFKRVLFEALESLDEPINDPASVPLYFLFEQLGQQYHKRVILSGEGSDELFMGYRPYLELLDMEKLSQLKKKNWLKNYFQAHYSPHREWEWYRRLFNDELLFRGSSESFTSSHLKSLLKSESATHDSRVLIEHLYQRYKAHTIKDPKIWYRYIDLKVHQGEYFLKKLDRVSMAHAIEARAPFMDERVVKYAMSLDPRLFLEEDRTKNLLKDLALNYLPKEIVERKKRGFSYPFIEWMDRMDAWAMMRDINKNLGIFDTKHLDLLIKGAQKGKFKHHTFGVFFLLLWLEKQGQLKG